MQKFLYKNKIILQYYNKAAFMIECQHAVKLVSRPNNVDHTVYV